MVFGGENNKQIGTGIYFRMQSQTVFQCERRLLPAKKKFTAMDFFRMPLFDHLQVERAAQQLPLGVHAENIV